MKWMLHHGMRIVRVIAGVAIILIGMGLGFVPGIPGFPLVFLGLTILAVDFVWAQRLKQRLKDETKKVVDKVRGKSAAK
jgi:flagellar biosynthesis component FlhA